MTDTTTRDDLNTASARRIPAPGETIHVLRSGLLVHTGEGSLMSGRAVILDRGQTFTVTSAMIDAMRDRHGSLDSSWLSLVYDDDAQIARYGEVIVRPGPAPEDLRPWVHGGPEWQVARDAARRRAWALPSEAEQHAALAEGEREYGPARSTSQTTATYRPGEHPTERAAAQQARDFAAARARGER